MSRKQKSAYAKKEELKASTKVDFYIKEQYKTLSKKNNLSEDESNALKVMHTYLDKYNLL